MLVFLFACMGEYMFQDQCSGVNVFSGDRVALSPAAFKHTPGLKW